MLEVPFVPEEIDDELEEIAYDWAENVIRWSEKVKKDPWPVERHIADAILSLLRIIYNDIGYDRIDEIRKDVATKRQV